LHVSTTALYGIRVDNGSVGGSGVLLFPVFDEVAWKPLDNVGGIVEVGWGRRHLLATGWALCRIGAKVIVVADGEFGDHVGSLWWVALGAPTMLTDEPQIYKRSRRSYCPRLNNPANSADTSFSSWYRFRRSPEHLRHLPVERLRSLSTAQSHSLCSGLCRSELSWCMSLWGNSWMSLPPQNVPLSRVDKLLRFVIGWLIRTDTW